MTYTVKSLASSDYQNMMTSVNSYIEAMDEETFADRNLVNGMFGPIGLVTSLVGAGMSLFNGGKALKKSQQQESNNVTVCLHNFTDIMLGIYEYKSGGKNPSDLIITPGKSTELNFGHVPTPSSPKSEDNPEFRMSLAYPDESEQPFIQCRFMVNPSAGFYLQHVNYNDGTPFDAADPAGYRQFLTGFDVSSSTKMPNFYLISSSIYDVSSGSCDMYLIQKS